MAEKVVEEKRSIRKVLREQLDAMQTITEEMGRTNLNNYPLKPHILRGWVEGLQEGLQQISEAMNQVEETKRKGQ